MTLRPGRPRATLVLVLTLATAAGTAAAGCGTPSTTSRPPASNVAASPARTAGPVVAQTRTAIEAALGARSVLLQDPPLAYRPGEANALIGMPRAVYQAILPDDPTNGYIVVYELADERTARAAAEAQAAYVGSPVGRVQFPFGTRFVVRQVGRTVIFYADPAESPDDQAADVVEALRTVGTEITVPS